MSRLRNQDGFTVMEMLMAITVGFVVLAATMGLLESSVRLNTGLVSKTDAMQRGRLGMDMVTQSLRSQVCLDYDNPAVISGDDNAITFYGDFTEKGTRPVKRRVTFDPVKGTITSYDFAAPTAPLPLKPDSFPIAPTRIQLVLEAVGNQFDLKTNKTVPFFTYYANRKDPADGVYRPNEKLSVPLNADDVKRVARIEVSFVAWPTGAKTPKQAVALTDQIMVRHLDPNVSLDPKCV
jgi:hypothetical protein